MTVDDVMSLIEEYGSLCYEEGTHKFPDSATHTNRALMAIRTCVESLVSPAELDRVKRQSDAAIDALSEVTVKILELVAKGKLI